MRAMFHVSCVLLCLIAGVVAAAAAGRVALVVGNAAYQNIDPLRTPGENARKLTAVLETLGFEVVEARDADLARLQGLIDEFARRCRDAEVAMFFYSGHAVQIEDRLYLLPADIGFTADTDLDLAALELEAVLRAMEASRAMRFAFLDVGRGNPWGFAAMAKADPLPGLAPLPDKAGTVVGFATSPGKSFEEGEGPLSPYAAALVATIGEPGLEIEKMMRRVRDEVIAATDGRQIPWSLSTVAGEFFLVPPR